MPYFRTSRKRSRRQRLGQMQCNVTAAGGRLCYDVEPAPVTTAALNADLTTPRISRPSRADLNAQFAINTAATQYVIPYDPQSQAPAGTLTVSPSGVVTSSAAATALAAPTGNTLFDTISSYLPSSLTGQSLVAGYPDWLVLLGGGAAIYFVTGRKGRR